MMGNTVSGPVTNEGCGRPRLGTRFYEGHWLNKPSRNKGLIGTLWALLPDEDTTLNLNPIIKPHLL